LLPVESPESIPQQSRNTPIGLLLEYHNLEKPYDVYTNAQVLVALQMYKIEDGKL
jgi:carbonic anhydrase